MCWKNMLPLDKSSSDLEGGCNGTERRTSVFFYMNYNIASYSPCNKQLEPQQRTFHQGDDWEKRGVL